MDNTVFIRNTDIVLLEERPLLQQQIKHFPIICF